MWFVGIGCLLLAMKLADFGFAATWSWLWILAPFGLAMVWWAFADSSGLTMRRAMDKMDERKHERRRRHMEALGLNWRRDRRVAVIKDARKVDAPIVAVKKTEQERHNRDVITAFLPSRQELPPPRQTADDKTD
jgi:small Trp-rich protein